MTLDRVDTAADGPGSCDFGRDYNPFAPSQRDDPYPTWARARQDSPVFYSEVLGAWVVSRHEDICQVVRDPVRFSSANAARPIGALPPEVEAVLAEGYAYEEMRVLLNSDPPAHTRLRRLLNVAFTPQRVAALAPRIRAIANELVDAFVQDGEADLVARFAYPLPLMVIMELLGVPPADRELVHKLSGDKLATLWGSLPLDQQVAAARGWVEFQRYFARLIEARRAAPADDLVSALVAARLDDERPLAIPEMVEQLNGMLLAGHETTTNLIAHAMILLLRHREQWAALVADPRLAAQTVEEVLRTESPVMGMWRTATEDVELAGVRIPKDARIQVLFGSANRDAAQFAEPDRFDIYREPTGQHLAFGRGTHFCIGAPLARLEGRIALETLAARLPDARLAPGHPITYQPNAAFRGPTALHLQWSVA